MRIEHTWSIPRELFDLLLLLLPLLSLLNLQEKFRRVAMEEGACGTLETLPDLPKLASHFSEVVGELTIFFFAMTAQVKTTCSTPLGNYGLVRSLGRGR